jgi:hypothetical protein
MNTDYQDIKAKKNPISVEICENLCPNLKFLVEYVNVRTLRV